MRLKVSKSKNAASLYVIRSTYVNKVHSSEVVEKLGTEAEIRERLNGADPYVWAKDYIDKLNAEEKENKRKVKLELSPTKVISKDNQRSFNGGYLFIQKIYNELGMKRICSSISEKYKFTFDLNLILSSLIYGRILFPASKLATKEISKTLIESPQIDTHHLYRSLDVIAKEQDFIQAALYKNSLKISKRNTGVLFYDCTNFYFEIEQEDGLKQYGKSKENRPNPIVEMGLFMDGDGIPLAFSIHPGNTNEQTTLKPLEKKILKDFELSKFVVCTDAGLSSIANRRYNSMGERSFVTTQSLKIMKAHLKDWSLDRRNWKMQSDNPSDKDRVYHLDQVLEHYNAPERTAKEKSILESKIFYKERWINENDFEQRLVVTFSIKFWKYQRQIRSRQVERAQKMLDKNPSKIGKCNANDVKRFIKKEHCTADGEIAEKELLSIDQDVIDKEAIYDGFYAVCTNLDGQVKEVINVNKGRWEIEECFRIMKSEFKSRPVYLGRDERITAHFMTCFISLIIYRLLEKKLTTNIEDGFPFTCESLLDTLREMSFLKVGNEGYIPTYKRSNITDALHESYGFRTDTEIVSTKEMKKIIKSTQK